MSSAPLVQDWFRVWEDTPGVWVIEEPLHSEQVKSYLVIGSERAALIDTGMGVGDLRALVTSITDRPAVVLQSHAHNDHVGSAAQFDDVRVHAAEADALAGGQSVERLADWFAPAEMSGPLPAGFEPLGYRIPGRVPDGFLDTGDVVDLGDRQLEVIHVPGHSAGGLVFLDRANRNLYSTDVVYLRQLYLLNRDSSVDDYVQSLERLADVVPLVDRLYPSHGPSPIEPKWILEMANGMRAVQAGRTPDRVENLPAMDGGREDTRRRDAILHHDFGDYEILVGHFAD